MRTPAREERGPHVRGQAAKSGLRENKTLFPSVRNHQSNDKRRPQQRRPCLSATRGPAGWVRRRRWGGGVCSALFAVPSVVSAKRFFWDRFPGSLRCRVRSQHISPPLSNKVKNSSEFPPQKRSQFGAAEALCPCRLCLTPCNLVPPPTGAFPAVLLLRVPLSPLPITATAVSVP